MKGSQEIALHGSSRRDSSRRVALEIMVWVIAFGLLLCQPADRASGDANARVDHGRTAVSR